MRRIELQPDGKFLVWLGGGACLVAETEAEADAIVAYFERRQEDARTEQRRRDWAEAEREFRERDEEDHPQHGGSGWYWAGSAGRN